ncbi:unnamed protein product [Gongylonema pulchrum]|uniref:Uncharacterized protein n=1 Tax=Gongylonema pulchrum TaxID=637853 RepID=A0A183EYF1_9BILA|nr:unnamed protein product [Gongylonema pulchrum]
MSADAFKDQNEKEKARKLRPSVPLYRPKMLRTATTDKAASREPTRQQQQQQPAATSYPPKNGWHFFFWMRGRGRGI